MLPLIRFIGVAIIMAALLTACGGSSTVRTDPGGRYHQAERLAQRGDYAGAAYLYEKQAAKASGDTRIRYQLFAADYYARAGQKDKALTLIEQVENAGGAGHPLFAGIKASIFGGGYLTSADQITILLPTTGKYAAAAQAVRQGITTANAQLPAQQRPALRFVDTGDAMLESALETAASAPIVIGPLTKEAVERVLRKGTLSGTVITLNQVSDNSPYGIYQFGLSPEEEGRQVAEKAWNDDYRTASVLYPSETWGDRYLEAFRSEWQSLGGAISTTSPYNPAEPQHTETIKSLLQAPGDFTYIVAKPLQARQLRTQLMYYGNAETPAYISSRGYDRRLFDQQAADLDGAWIPTFPWTIPPKKPRAASAGETGQTDSKSSEKIMADSRDSWNAPSTPVSTPSLTMAIPSWETLEASGDFNPAYARFYALGIDAHLLALNARQLTTGNRVDGATGALYPQASGTILRQPLWLHYSNGNIETIGPLPPY